MFMIKSWVDFMDKNPRSAALVNDDYEYELFREELGPEGFAVMQRQRLSCEYMFFFVNQDNTLPLYSAQGYSPQYLAYLQELGISVPQIVSQGPVLHWYGSLQNRVKEKKLNSKLWGYELLNQLGLHPSEYHVVQDLTEAKKVIHTSKRKRWILKPPYFMSGDGFQILEDGKDAQSFTGPHILEPYYERLLDLVLYYNPEEDITRYHLCQGTREGKYQGGIIFDSDVELVAYVASRGLTNAFDELKRRCSIVLEHLKQLGLDQPVALDCFLFREDDKIGYHPCCDINYRRSYGSLIQSLRRFLPAGGCGQLLVMRPVKALKHYEMLPYDKDTKTGLIYLTPEGTRPVGLFFTGASMLQVDRLIKTFFSQLYLDKVEE